MSDEFQQYWQVIREKVCAKCIDSDGMGNCRLDPSIECAVQMYLPLIVDVVNRIESDRMDDYVRELRTLVCEHCKYQTVNGYCGIHNEIDCALDRYFPLVINAIEEVNHTVRK